MSENDLSDNNQAVIWDILHYLIKNPDAKDTIDGILKWWIPKTIVIEQKRSEMQEVLNFLVSNRLLIKEDIFHSKIYSVNKEYLEEVKKLLNEIEDDRRI